MRIKTGQTIKQGSVLLVTLCSAWVIGIALVSFLTLVANQNRTTYHSQTWSSCIPILESGIEEALTQLNFNNCEGMTNAETHGWTNVGGLYQKSRIMDDLSGSYFETTIDPNAAATPVITSKGWAPAPGNTGNPMGGETAFGMIFGTVSQSTPAMVCRTVVVGTRLQNSGGGTGGIQTKGGINFSGTNSILDSFDSSDPLYSTGGQYDPTKRKSNGIAMSNSAAAGAISVGTAHIYGSVTTGPNGTVTVNTGSTTPGAVGDLNWNSSSSGIQSGHQGSDANIQFDNVSVPFLYGSGSTPTAVGGSNYVLNAATNTKWNMGAVNLGNGKSINVIGGDVTLYVNGNFITSGSGYVNVAPGASLKLYVSGVFAVSGTGIVNGSGLASKLNVYGLSTATQTWAYSGTSAFIGTVYAPYANFTFSGSAGAMGSFGANSVTISGGASVHYDETLSPRQDPKYLASSWNEI
jgi:hypothetical protein